MMMRDAGDGQKKNKNKKEKIEKEASKGHLPRRVKKNVVFFFLQKCCKKSCSNWGQKVMTKQTKNQTHQKKKKKERGKTNRKPWTLKVALRPSGVLLVFFRFSPLPSQRNAHVSFQWFTSQTFYLPWWYAFFDDLIYREVLNTIICLSSSSSKKKKNVNVTPFTPELSVIWPNGHEWMDHGPPRKSYMVSGSGARNMSYVTERLLMISGPQFCDVIC